MKTTIIENTDLTMFIETFSRKLSEINEYKVVVSSHTFYDRLKETNVGIIYYY